MVRNTHENVQANFLSRLDELLTEEGWNQSRLAQKSGIAKSTISYWKNDGRMPSKANLEILAKTFNVSVLYLAGYTDNRKPEHAEIGKELGLEENSIEMLLALQKSKRKSTLTTLNYLISNHKLVRLLEMYLLSFIIEEIQNTDLKLLPLRNSPPKNYERSYRTAIVKELEEYSKIIAERLKKNSSLVDELIYEYLAKNVDCTALDEAKLYFALDKDDAEIELEDMAMAEFSKGTLLSKLTNTQGISNGGEDMGSYDKSEEFSDIKNEIQRRLNEIKKLLDYMNK